MVRRRKFIRVISYFAAICVVFAAGGLSTSRAKAEYEETLEKVRVSNLTSLCEYTRDISAGLRLLAVSSDDALSDSAAYVCSRAMGAQGCIGAFDSEKVKNISRFISGVYDFAEGFSGSDTKRETAVKLSNYAQELYYHLSDLSTAVINGAYSLSEFGSIYFKNELPYFEDYLDFSNGTEDEIFSLTAPAVSSRGSVEFLSDKEDISPEQARKKASGFININPALWRESEADGRDIEVYAFTHGDTAVEISKIGGFLCRLVNPLPCAAAEYSFSDAREKAEKFLADCGYKDTVALRGEKSDFSARFVFAPKVNGVLLLNAAVQVEICLASGEITYFEGAEYIRNYRTDIYADKSAPDLSGRLPSNLTLRETQICYAEIGGRERLCYVAECLFEGETVTVYADYYSCKVLKVE